MRNTHHPSMPFHKLAALLLLVGVELAARLDVVGALPRPTSNCMRKCGDVEIPYPFGLGNDSADCALPGFNITCSKMDDGAYKPFLFNLEILNISLQHGVLRVMNYISSYCYNSTSGNMDQPSTWDLELTNTPYRLSNTGNMFTVLGCYTQAYIGHDEDNVGRYDSGCVSMCRMGTRSLVNGSCSGLGCCQTAIPPGLQYYKVQFEERFGNTRDCSYAVLMDSSNFTFSTSYATTPHFNTTYGGRAPLVLDWALRDSNTNVTGMTCAEVRNTPEYACVSEKSECVDSVNAPGYFCNCTTGFDGNPYLHGGCTNINECDRPTQYPCNGVCRDTVGSYDCKCRAGYGSVGSPKDHPCNPKFPLVARIALGVCLVVFILVVALLLAFIMLQKRKLDELFEKNGGNILKNVNGLTIFTKEGLRKITRDNAEFLGNGSFGKVYKGTLPDNTIVAVKASIKVDEGTKEKFVEEIEIQTNMIHKNILKLVGCCLEVDVPMLVYEFAANGSLQDILHGKKGQILSLDSRLDIAIIGSAEGLKYMHCYATQAMRHGDVKPDNILLDDKLTPKISDFGLSKLLKREYYAKTVVGCMGYIDPVFMKTGLLTQKSDVYSFGAVLLELITGKANVYDQTCSVIIEYHKFYEKEKSGRTMFDTDIATEEDIAILEQMGKLAMDCLKEDIDDRPDMTEVTEQLVMIRRAKKFGKSNCRTPHTNGNITINVSPDNTDFFPSA